MEIKKEHVEWAVVNRLCLLLTDERPETEYEVTLTFALFAGIVLWSRQSLGRCATDKEWPDAARLLLCEKATALPWGIREDRLVGTCKVKEFSGRDTTVTLKDATAWQLIVFLRNCIGHGDGRTVKPHDREWKPHSPKRRLDGFIFTDNKNPGASVCLSAADMIRVGERLARVFCQAYGLQPNQEKDAQEGVVEKDRPLAKAAEI